jgi:hypothetical protein
MLSYKSMAAKIGTYCGTNPWLTRVLRTYTFVHYFITVLERCVGEKPAKR